MQRLPGWPKCTCESHAACSHPGTRGWEGGSKTSSRVSLCPLQSVFLLLPFQKDINSSLLNNYVLGAQLGHGPVNNLSDRVNISFWHNQSLVLLGAPHPHFCPTRPLVAVLLNLV